MIASTRLLRPLFTLALLPGLMQVAFARSGSDSGDVAGTDLPVQAQVQTQAEARAIRSDASAAGSREARPAGDRVSDYLAQKFGVAKEKAVQISNAVRVASEKYALPPALLLAIISIESRFKEKAKGRNGATGLMQVVPSAHRPLLKNVKDLTEPDTNIEVGSAILYGYMKSAGGDLDAALKSYGGSKAYAEMVGVRAKTFALVFEPPAQSGAAEVWQAMRAGECDARWTEFCVRPVVWPGTTADLTEDADPASPQPMRLPGVLLPLLR
ncbi:transglycosylase SLT domain-containing protein [Paraburkholderia sp. SARCC-3016]|uniref:transglycosylase SLT domain-containing protein n=1 Tax=Paraburkholderia sp. SARCC-3016 TaxID=3058611 RepID=UPI00280972C6|nr:transglycosylase SLT domain-containing protein [Paraburkholderia sp. SARCC-3016]MDQ7979654.1 transglycosylase SLT domain-containing protein [Paraburkholderia sp. SARCC-3016]